MTYSTLTASDGHNLALYTARPQGASRGNIIVLQEIFGVNSHIRAVCDRLAELGYTAAAPALFDRLQKGHDTGYAPEDIERGLQIVSRFSIDDAQLDLTATLDALADSGPTSIMGFCLGGSLAYKMACVDSRVASAACYYGGLIEGFADDTPACPVMMHYGAQDPTIPPENVATVRKKQPDLPVYVYSAGHGFNCDARPAYDAGAAAVAWTRSMRMIDAVSTAT